MSGTPLLEDGEADPAAAESATQRELRVLDANGNADRKFADNAVSTTKYSFLPTQHFFLWKNLFEQFHKLANVYFLVISGLQVIPGISPTGRFNTLGPFVLVLLVTMAKDVYEDVKRLRSDRDLNSSKTKAWRSGDWTEILWKELRVGDLCRVHKGSSFPADLVLAWSPDPEGMCYIETANLDGETNLKIRKAPGELYRMYSTTHPDSAIGKVTCELPNNRLYNFDGVFEKSGKPKVPLTADNLLLRGANLRNTKDIVGIVVFTGADTKLMRNSSAKASKMSRVDRVTNKQIFLVFLLLVVLCVAHTVAAAATQRKEVGKHWYLADGADTQSFAAFIFASFATFLILFNNLIPISLYVTTEMVKLVQANQVNNDLEMYYETNDMPAVARTSSLNEELGQVEYIFSDKTGTLTCNMMDFLKFTTTRYDVLSQREMVVSYGTGTTEIGRVAAEREGRVLQDDRPEGWEPRNNFFFYDPHISDLQWRREDNAPQLEFFFVFLAVCHAVIPERNSQGETVYQAASPDEGCLVKAARELGVRFLERTESSVTIDVAGDVQKWDILRTIEFDSTRKRMSVVCQDPRGKLMLLCKGADTVIYARLRKDTRTTLHSDTLDLLTKFAAEGLRTLVLGKVDLDEATYSKWARKYDEASVSLVDRQGKMAAVAEELEVNLELVGSTAIEDKLQEGVPATIELLSKAGIKIWVLTGDKQETAINIGFACALLHADMGLFMFDECRQDTIEKVLQVYLSDARGVTQQDLGLVIQGDMLEHVLPTEEESKSGATRREGELFLSLATRCKAVICCRVSPLQKACVVKLVRSHIDTVTLAVGDGANDVSMIQAAHVGIGISGLEGLQASLASDYSIGQFRFLKRLLLIHGRYNYRRISKLVMYCFYKNVTLFVTQFYYAWMNLNTGTSLYDGWALSLYNLLFTTYPIIVYAVLDRDVTMSRLLSKDQFPELYHDGMKDLIFTTLSFWMFMANALVQSIICFFVSLYIGQSMELSDGVTLGLPGTGIMCYTAILLTVTGKMCLEIQSWTIPNIVVNVGSLALWFIFLAIYGNLYAWLPWSDFANWYGAPALTLSSGVFWFGVVLQVTLCLLRDVVWKFWRHNYKQKLAHVVQEFEAQGRRFTRQDVVRCAASLLPRFQSLRPYEMNKNTLSLFGDMELQMTTLAGASKGFARNLNTRRLQYFQDQRPLEKTGNRWADLSRGRVAIFSKPGKTKISDIVDSDL